MKKNWNFSKAQFLWYDCTFKKQCTVSVTLTIDLWRSMFFQWIECHPINILHKFQIDISSNSREIKYQNIGRTHTHTDRQTHTHTDRQTDRVKTIPRNPLRGRGNNQSIDSQVLMILNWQPFMNRYRYAIWHIYIYINTIIYNLHYISNYHNKYHIWNLMKTKFALCSFYGLTSLNVVFILCFLQSSIYMYIMKE